MTLLSIEFYIITVCLLIVYYLLPKSGQWLLLLFAGFAFFLLMGTPYTIVYLLVSILSIYASGSFLASGKKGRKTVLIATIVLNIGMLVALKYTDFILSGVQGMVNIFGAGITVPSVQLISSLGISFYTFQVIGYLCDVYWGTAEAQKNPLKFALFASYFPLLISGPICRYHELRDRLYEKHTFDFAGVTSGAQRVLWGIAKKLIIAERLAPLVNTVFSSPDTYGRFAWAASFGFAVQLYADFSGSIDIIMGISECFGIKLPENFKAPFFSRSVQEFWQRWHISLGGWFRDYLMYPLMRSRLWMKMSKRLKTAAKGGSGKKAAKMIPVFSAMLILWVCIGIWHGGGFKFILQGLWFWLFIILGQIWTAGQRDGRTVPLFRCLQSVRTFVIFSGGLIFFRAENTGSAFAMLKNALMPFAASPVSGESLIGLIGGTANLLIITAGMLFVLTADYFAYKEKSLRECVGRQNIALRWALYYALIFAVILFGMYGGGYNPADFIYGGF